MFGAVRRAFEDTTIGYYHELWEYHSRLVKFHKALLKREEDLNHFQEMLQADFRSLQEIHNG